MSVDFDDIIPVPKYERKRQIYTNGRFLCSNKTKDIKDVMRVTQIGGETK